MAHVKRNPRITKILYPRLAEERPRRKQSRRQERSWRRECLCFWSLMSELDLAVPPVMQRQEREVLDGYTRTPVKLYVIGGRDLDADREREEAHAAERRRWLRLVDDDDERLFILPRNRTCVREHGEMHELED